MEEDRKLEVGNKQLMKVRADDKIGFIPQILFYYQNEYPIRSAVGEGAGGLWPSMP